LTRFFKRNILENMPRQAKLDALGTLHPSAIEKKGHLTL
jgi:hypothetical protein